MFWCNRSRFRFLFKVHLKSFSCTRNTIILITVQFFCQWICILALLAILNKSTDLLYLFSNRSDFISVKEIGK